MARVRFDKCDDDYDRKVFYRRNGLKTVKGKIDIEPVAEVSVGVASFHVQ